jgi:hypothetical protein
MPRRPKLDTDEDRSERLKKDVQEQRVTDKLKDAELDAMVRQSIKTHGP